MPFANRGSGIALSFAKRGERESCRLNVQRRAASFRKEKERTLQKSLGVTASMVKLET